VAKVDEVLYGPMFSGKSRGLIKRLDQAVETGQTTIAIRPAVGLHVKPVIWSRDGFERPAMLARSGAEVSRLIGASSFVVLDEIQFFDDDLLDAIGDVADDVRVVAAGLDLDFRGETFGVTLKLAERASSVTRLTAVCTKCGRPASMTQRLDGGLPAPRSAPTVVLEDAASYEPRCSRCHVIP
jgi:thymidine kinase